MIIFNSYLRVRGSIHQKSWIQTHQWLDRFPFTASVCLFKVSLTAATVSSSYASRFNYVFGQQSIQYHWKLSCQSFLINMGNTPGEKREGFEALRFSLALDTFTAWWFLLDGLAKPSVSLQGQKDGKEKKRCLIERRYFFMRSVLSHLEKHWLVILKHHGLSLPLFTL